MVLFSESKPFSIMTSTNGTYMICDGNQTFSISMTCAGPDCGAIMRYNNLNCTQTDSDFWQCRNGVVCFGSALFSSSFLIAQSNETVIHTQNVSLNGTNFVLQQAGTGNATVSNATTSSSSTDTVTTPVGTPTTSSSTAPSTFKSGSSSRQGSYSGALLILMLFLGICVTQSQAVLTGQNIGEEVNGIFEGLMNAKDFLGISSEVIAGEFGKVAAEICGALVSTGVGGLVGIGDAFGECEEAMVGLEMSQIGSSLGLVLRSYAGIGGLLVEGITAAEEVTVLAADAGAIPEIFIVNSALCGLLVTVLAKGALGISATDLCSAVESAAASIGASKPASPSTSTSAATSSALSAPSTATGLVTIPKISATSGPAACALCYIVGYFVDLNSSTLAYCSPPQPDYYVPAKYLVRMFCDTSVANIEPFMSLCSAACLYPCQQYSLDGVIQVQGTAIEPTWQNDFCGDLCDGAGDEGNCPVFDGQYETVCNGGLCPGADQGCNIDCTV
jgi:hypothetical protein